MVERLLAGIDIGSSAVKAGLFTLAGEQVAVSRVPCDSTGEMEPEGWWQATQEALGRLDVSGVVAAGVCGRGGTGVLLDEAGRVAAPSWSDGRAAETVRLVREEHPALSPQSLNLLGRACWARAERGVRVARAVSAKDYITWRLTGTWTSDPASGGSTGDACGVLTPASAPWSLNGATVPGGPFPAGTAVAVGWHDGAAAAFGAGAAHDASAPVTLGTTAVYRVVARQLPPGLRKYWDLTPGLTVTGGDITGAGRAFAWAQTVLAGADAARSPAGSRGVTFLPQFSGRIAPDRNPSARGAWWGLDGSQAGDDLLRAVVEGTAFALRQVRDWLAGHGLKARRIVATGGGARNPLQLRVLADVLGEPVLAADVEEGCRGAALLGGVAAGLLDLERARQMAPAWQRIEPSEAGSASYREAFARFLAVQAAADRATEEQP